MTNYNPAIPTPEELLSESQPELLDNFTSLNTYLTKNHEAFTSANFGKHKFLTMTNQTDGLTTGVNEIGLYSHDDKSGDPQLFFRNRSTKAGTLGTQLTPMPNIFAWVNFKTAGTITGSFYNVNTVIRNSTGNYTISFIKPSTNVNFFYNIVPRDPAKALNIRLSNVTINDINFEVVNNVGGPVDPAQVNMILWGGS